MGKRTKNHNRNNSVIMANLKRQEEMFNIYAGYTPQMSSPHHHSTKKHSMHHSEVIEDPTFSTLPQNDYTILPSIHRFSPAPKTNFLKQNMSIANQVIRSYRSFSRRHAYNTRFEISDQESATENTFDLAKETTSTNANSSPKATRSKSQMAKKPIEERVITVKPIEGRQVLESIQETKDSQQR